MKNNKIQHTNNDGSAWTECYFSQDSVRMDYTVDADGTPYFTYYDNMDIIGIVDDRVIGSYFSVWALSQEHIINLDDTVIENVDLDVDVFAQNSTIYVSVNNDVEIEVYSLRGMLLSRQMTSNGVARIDVGNENCVIVRVGNSVHKVAVK